MIYSQLAPVYNPISLPKISVFSWNDERKVIYWQLAPVWFLGLVKPMQFTCIMIELHLQSLHYWEWRQHWSLVVVWNQTTLSWKDNIAREVWIKPTHNAKLQTYLKQSNNTMVNQITWHRSWKLTPVICTRVTVPQVFCINL